MTIQAHDTPYSPVNPSQFLGDAISSNNTDLNPKRDDSAPILTTPSATAMDSQTTPNPALPANVAANAMCIDAETSTHDDEAATSAISTDATATTNTTTTAPAAATVTAAVTTAVAQQANAKQFYFGEHDEDVVTLNLNSLLPKKTKHGRIGGSLYRALRDAGVDVAALGIPRGRPPRTVVGQKRPKRPTLLSLIKSGAELPMVPGAPRLRIVNIEMVPEEYEGQEGKGGLQDLTNKQQRRRGGNSRSTSKRKVGGTMGNKRAKVAVTEGGKQEGGGGQEGPMEGLVADDEAATGLLLLLGETSS